MLRIVLLAAQGAVLALVAWELGVAFWGWPGPRRSAVSARNQKFRVVVPARDEAAVIAGVLGDVINQDYPAALIDTWVIADRCSDETASIASKLARVAERSEGPDGKGAALGWYLERHPLDEDEALVVLDADNRVPGDLLARFADELADGAGAVQAYLDVTNPDGSVLATASALSYWAGNRMVQLSRHNLGWGSDLGGTGMCVAAEALDSAGGFGRSLVEDQELAVRLRLGDIAVRWAHDVRVRDEKPEGVTSALRQRARWSAGKRSTARRYVGALLARGFRTGSLWPLDWALRLVQPGRSFLALITALLAIAAAVTNSIWLLPWQIWATAASLLIAVPFAFLVRDGTPVRYLIRYPLIILLPLLWLPIRILSRFGGDRWHRTPHGAGDHSAGAAPR